MAKYWEMLTCDIVGEKDATVGAFLISRITDDQWQIMISNDMENMAETKREHSRPYLFIWARLGATKGRSLPTGCNWRASFGFSMWGNLWGKCKPGVSAGSLTKSFLYHLHRHTSIIFTPIMISLCINDRHKRQSHCPWKVHGRYPLRELHLQMQVDFYSHRVRHYFHERRTCGMHFATWVLVPNCNLELQKSADSFRAHNKLEALSTTQGKRETLVCCMEHCGSQNSFTYKVSPCVEGSEWDEFQGGSRHGRLHWQARMWAGCHCIILPTQCIAHLPH